MLIAKIQDNTVTDVADYRAMFPSVVFPDGGPTDEWLTTNSCMRVNLFKPYDASTQLLEPCAPHIEGEWVYTVQVRDMTADELAARDASQAANVRAQRDRLLADKVDSLNVLRWEEISESEQSAWRQYRRELLDVPEQAGFPWSVQWPAAPGAVVSVL